MTFSPPQGTPHILTCCLVVATNHVRAGGDKTDALFIGDVCQSKVWIAGQHLLQPLLDAGKQVFALVGRGGTSLYHRIGFGNDFLKCLRLREHLVQPGSGRRGDNLEILLGGPFDGIHTTADTHDAHNNQRRQGYGQKQNKHLAKEWQANVADSDKSGGRL
jgi:hypothetical protein